MQMMPLHRDIVEYFGNPQMRRVGKYFYRTIVFPGGNKLLCVESISETQNYRSDSEYLKNIDFNDLIVKTEMDANLPYKYSIDRNNNLFRLELFPVKNAKKYTYGARGFPSIDIMTNEPIPDAEIDSFTFGDLFEFCDFKLKNWEEFYK